MGVPWWDPNNENLCIWSAYQPKGAASFAASLVDLSGNGNDAAAPGAPATPGWNAVNGWIFDGINDYLITAFVPQNDQSQSVLVQFTNEAGANSRWLFGMSSGANRNFGISPKQGGTQVRYRNGQSTNAVPQVAAANLCVAGNQGYRNGAIDGGAIAAWIGASTHAVYIGAYNAVGVAAAWVQAHIQALALYDCTLTAPQVAAVAAAMALL